LLQSRELFGIIQVNGLLQVSEKCDGFGGLHDLHEIFYLVCGGPRGLQIGSIERILDELEASLLQGSRISRSTSWRSEFW
jgi:hypothetical protein